MAQNEDARTPVLIEHKGVRYVRGNVADNYKEQRDFYIMENKKLFEFLSNLYDNIGTELTKFNR